MQINTYLFCILLDLHYLCSKIKEIMGVVYFIAAIGSFFLILFAGLMWYDRAHNYDW